VEEVEIGREPTWRNLLKPVVGDLVGFRGGLHWLDQMK